jgi:ribosomal protein S18 acetylase RimI-like enzyme
MSETVSFDIVTVTRADAEFADAIARLLPQLSANAAVPSAGEQRELIESPCNTILVARDHQGGSIIGMLTLAVFRIPTGVRAWIEDVIVDQAARGRGIGEALTRESLRIAKEKGARTVELTSRPSRQAANRLYQRVGFVKRETNVYRYSAQ